MSNAAVVVIYSSQRQKKSINMSGSKENNKQV